MKVGLFIPCYIDQFYPQVGIATLKLLENLGVEVEFPMDQACCGQPMANSGHTRDALSSILRHADIFSQYDTVVCPSGSCVSFIKHQTDFVESSAKLDTVRENTYELCEFLIDKLKISRLDSVFPHKVGLHNCCHGHRGLRLAKSSELVETRYSKVRQLLSLVRGIELVTLEKEDECCGFGGTFAVFEESVSVKMGLNRVADHMTAGAEYITGVDMSCLMHMDGLIKRNQFPIQVKHIAEILSETT